MPPEIEEQKTLVGEARERVEVQKKEIDQLLLDPSLHTPDIPVSPFTQFLITTNKVVQTLSRLLGFNRKDKKWQAIRVNPDGDIQVISYKRRQSKAWFWSDYTIGTTIVRIIAPTANLVDICIKNSGTTLISIGSSPGLETIARWNLTPGDSIIFDRYTGEIHAVSDAAGGKIEFFYTYEPRETYLPPSEEYELG